MKVLAINSSARKDGNTAILISRVFEELNKEGIETEMIQLAGQVIDPAGRAGPAVGSRIASTARIISIRFLTK